MQRRNVGEMNPEGYEQQLVFEGMPEVQVEKANRIAAVGASVGRWALRAGLVGMGAIASLGIFGTAEREVGPATIEASVNLAGTGNVTTNVSLGEATFDYTDGLLGLDMRVKSIRRTASERIQSSLDLEEPIDSINVLEPELQGLMAEALVRGNLSILLGGLLGGLMSERLLGNRNWLK